MGTTRSDAPRVLTNFRLPETGKRWQTNDMKTLKSFFVVGSLLCAGVAFADDGLDRAIANFNGISKLAYAKTTTYGAVAGQTGVPIPKLITDRGANNLDYAELLVAESLAVATGKPVQAIVAQQASGQSWSDVARKNRINPASLTARLQAAGEVMHAVAERAYNKQRRQLISDNLGRGQGNAQAVAAQAGLGH